MVIKQEIPSKVWKSGWKTYDNTVLTPWKAYRLEGWEIDLAKYGGKKKSILIQAFKVDGGWTLLDENG